MIITDVLKLLQDHPDLPVLLSSGYSHERVRDRLADGSPTHFLHKPYRLKALQQALRQALHAQG